MHRAVVQFAFLFPNKISTDMRNFPASLSTFSLSVSVDESNNSSKGEKGEFQC